MIIVCVCCYLHGVCGVVLARRRTRQVTRGTRDHKLLAVPAEVLGARLS